MVMDMVLPIGMVMDMVLPIGMVMDMPWGMAVGVTVGVGVAWDSINQYNYFYKLHNMVPNKKRLRCLVDYCVQKKSGK